MTGLSRAEPTRPVARHRKTAWVEDRRGRLPLKPFRRRYARADIRLLAEADAELGQMSGSAARAMLRREWRTFGNPRFERLARLSNGVAVNRRKTKTYRARRSNDNALVESKNASVIRKWLGHGRIPAHLAESVNVFNREWLSPFLNNHRPCQFPTEVTDAMGRERKRHRDADVMTLYEKLKSLGAVAHALSVPQAVRALNRARADLFALIDEHGSAAA